jgi:hypothetical protein
VSHPRQCHHLFEVRVIQLTAVPQHQVTQQRSVGNEGEHIDGESLHGEASQVGPQQFGARRVVRCGTVLDGY